MQQGFDKKRELSPQKRGEPEIRAYLDNSATTRPCREAVEAHGGILEVERTGPDGTVFMFTVRKKEAAP